MLEATLGPNDKNCWAKKGALQPIPTAALSFESKKSLAQEE
jgi:hypothetical protein